MGSWETFLIDTRTDWRTSTIEGTAKLAEFASSLSIGDIPTHVVERAVDLYVDWAGSAFSGARHRAIVAIDDFAKEMGPDQGRSEVLISGRMTSPYFAAFVNAAASHVSEQDDVHNGSVFHPGAVVFPAGLAIAQHCNASGTEFLTACVAGSGNISALDTTRSFIRLELQERLLRLPRQDVFSNSIPSRC